MNASGLLWDGSTSFKKKNASGLFWDGSTSCSFKTFAFSNRIARKTQAFQANSGGRQRSYPAQITIA